MHQNKKILLIISGGIAAYKSLELIRLLKKDGATVRCILTKGGAEFITPLSVASLSENPVYTDLWSLKDETEMGHIRLSRECDLIVVAPASANMIAKMAHGMADDLAAATLLAANKPIMVCPAMNPMMWENASTKDNIETLKKRGIIVLDPANGEMACGEFGAGRLPEAAEILKSIQDFFFKNKPLAGLTALLTAGPTFEAIDPVRFIGNRSSGKQGYAIGRALIDLGANVTLISGPTNLAPPANVKFISVESADEMLNACQNALPVDIFIAAAAVADFAPEKTSTSKIKKTDKTLNLSLKQNPDILVAVAAPSPKRPRLVVGFAAETENLLENAAQKRVNKNCDWVVANAVTPENSVFGNDENKVYFITPDKTEEWPKMGKDDVAKKLVAHISSFFSSSR